MKKLLLYHLILSGLAIFQCHAESSTPTNETLGRTHWVFKQIIESRANGIHYKKVDGTKEVEVSVRIGQYLQQKDRLSQYIYSFIEGFGIMIGVRTNPLNQFSENIELDFARKEKIVEPIEHSTAATAYKSEPAIPNDTFTRCTKKTRSRTVSGKKITLIAYVCKTIMPHEKYLSELAKIEQQEK